MDFICHHLYICEYVHFDEIIVIGGIYNIFCRQRRPEGCSFLKIVNIFQGESRREIHISSMDYIKLAGVRAPNIFVIFFLFQVWFSVQNPWRPLERLLKLAVFRSTRTSANTFVHPPVDAKNLHKSSRFRQAHSFSYDRNFKQLNDHVYKCILIYLWQGQNIHFWNYTYISEL